MLLRHGPTPVFWSEMYEADCPVCTLTFTRTSWVAGKGHKHMDADPILGALRKAFKSKGGFPSQAVKWRTSVKGQGNAS